MSRKKIDKVFLQQIESFKKNSTASRVPELLMLAAKVGLPADVEDPRNFWLGSVGIRKDGVLVSAKNGAVHSTSVDNYQLIPGSHAEGRCLKKLGHGGVVYVGRISKKDYTLAMARPCPMCQIRLKSYNVEKVYYTIDQNHYGVWYPKTNRDKIFSI